MNHPMNGGRGELLRCPACDDDLGTPRTREPDGRPRRPALRLELCVEQRGAVDWRLSLFDGSRFWPPSPGFHPARVRLVYRVCGDGHVFLEHVVTGGAAAMPTWRVDQFDVIAAIGQAATGKSYLMLRTLSQHLTISGLTHVDTPVPPAQVSVYNADWLLEAEPLELLKRQYLQTEIRGMTIEPTLARDLMPYEFLTDNVAAGVVQQILDIHTELLGRDSVDRDSWGQRIRQPIVRRYQIGNRRVMAAVADLAGESFASNAVQSLHNRFLLRNYGTLVWTIDPVVCTPFPKFLPAGTDRTSLAASMRPDGLLYDRTDEVRRERNVVQRQLAGTLTELGTISEDVGPVQYLLVCVTKADLIRHALAGGASLRKLGSTDAVVRGTARYLADVAARAGGPHPSVVVEDAAWRQVIGRIAGFAHDPALGTRVAWQFADAIVNHHDQPDTFWELVDGGGGGVVDVPEGVPEAVLPPGRLTVPTLDDHVAGSLVPGQSGVLRLRDLVMSALGCGIAYGLGFEQNIDMLLSQPWREPRFFLCSALGEVPVPGSSEELIKPMDSDASFPDFDTRSAALSQLLLCMLRRVRP